jgi:hypothetical protein
VRTGCAQPAFGVVSGRRTHCAPRLLPAITRALPALLDRWYAPDGYALLPVAAVMAAQVLSATGYGTQVSAPTRPRRATPGTWKPPRPPLQVSARSSMQLRTLVDHSPSGAGSLAAADQLRASPA